MTDRYDEWRDDIAAATAQLRFKGNPEGKLAALNTAVLIDIAESLSVLALESNVALQQAGILAPVFLAEPEPRTERTGEPDPDDPETYPLEVGDDVTTTADNRLECRPGRITALSVREGVEAALVEWEDGAAGWVFVTNLVRNDEPTGQAPEVDEDEVNPRDLIDDVDSDFDGDQHPATVDALATLRAREGKSKPKAKR